MKPKISIITLGVKDHDASRAFYRDGLGFPVAEGSNDDITFFELEGTWFALYPKEKLAEDALIENPEWGKTPSFTLAHNVGSKEKVDEVVAFAAKAGAEIVKQPQEVFWGGYSGYFKDPDGYLWEVAYNPFTDLT